jgi:hypothetical protein
VIVHGGRSVQTLSWDGRVRHAPRGVILAGAAAAAEEVG